MMDETINNINFLKETIGKFKNELHKFIADPNYSNHNAVNIRNMIEDLEQKIISKEKNIAGMILNENKNIFNNIINKSEILPDINQYDSVKYVKRNNYNINNNLNSNFSNKKNSLKFYGETERKIFKAGVQSRRNKDPFSEILLNRKNLNVKKRETYELLGKYNIKTNSDRDYSNGINTTSKVNFMDKSKLLKYSSFNKNYFKGIEYDDNYRPIISKDEIDKGILNLIYKGLIPRSADLTPAFNRDGHPLNLSNKVKEIYRKTKLRDEIELMQRSTVGAVDTRTVINKNEDGFFITNKNEKDLKETINESINETIKDSNNNSNEIEEKEHRKLVNHLMNNKITLLFSGFKIIQNGEYHKFRVRNEERWGFIVYFIEHLQKLLKKLNFSNVEIEVNKLESIVLDEFRTFSIQDFLGCICEKDLIKFGINLNDHRSISLHIRDIFIIRIQNHFRSYLARKKVYFIRTMEMNIKKIQVRFKIFKLYKECKNLIQDNFYVNLSKWRAMQDKFKINWKSIKENYRIEIHLNSLSYSYYKNSTIEKFAQKENNQISRIIALADPNLEIIYISPFDITYEVLSYYFSILQTMGIDNAKERFHIIVPEIKSYLNPNFSLTQLLLFSKESLSSIRKKIKGKETKSYIVPGVISKFDLQLSMYLDCPILLDNYEMTEALFTKSGSKRVFELNNMAVPISSWDIKSEDEFFNSFTLLVKNYLNINIWIFKIDNEHGGRGIAYVTLDKINKFVELKKNRLNNVILDDSTFENSLKSILIKSIPKKAEIVYDKLYRGWDEFFIEFCNCRGVIEACPTSSLSGIFGNPCISMFIEPDGDIDNVGSFDKINASHFKNFGATSPQCSILNLVKVYLLFLEYSINNK